jgi:hypothetical protein
LALFKKSVGFTKSWRFSKNQADLQNLGAFPKIRRIFKIQADFQNSGGFSKYRRLQKIRRLYCLGSAESPAVDFLLVWLKSTRSDPRKCDVPLMQSPSERWTACTLLLFACSLPYCTGCLYRPDMPKFPRKSKN